MAVLEDFFFPVFMIEKHEVEKPYHNQQMDIKTDETRTFPKIKA
ncbi:MAG: hypothetical protein NTV89_11045 [Proteobacteria bacterium]|nr:hypothetical protein [Pseudomonadota bacterium]